MFWKNCIVSLRHRSNRTRKQLCELATSSILEYLFSPSGYVLTASATTVPVTDSVLFSVSSYCTNPVRSCFKGECNIAKKPRPDRLRSFECHRPRLS